MRQSLSSQNYPGWLIRHNSFAEVMLHEKLVYLNTRISDHVKYSHDTRFKAITDKEIPHSNLHLQLTSEHVLDERKAEDHT